MLRPRLGVVDQIHAALNLDDAIQIVRREVGNLLEAGDATFVEGFFALRADAFNNQQVIPFGCCP